MSSARSYSVASHRCAKERRYDDAPQSFGYGAGKRHGANHWGDNDSLRVLFVVGPYFSGSVGAVKRPCQRERSTLHHLRLGTVGLVRLPEALPPMLSGR